MTIYTKKMVTEQEENATGDKGRSRRESYSTAKSASDLRMCSGYSTEVDNYIAPAKDPLAIPIRRKFYVDRLSLPHIEGVPTEGLRQFDPKFMRRTRSEIFKDGMRSILQENLIWATVVAVAVTSLILYLLTQLGQLEGHELHVYVIQVSIHSAFVLEMLIRLYVNGLSYFSAWHDVLDSFVVAVAFSLIFVTEAGAVVSIGRVLMVIWREEQRRIGSRDPTILTATGTTTTRRHLLARKRRRSKGEGDGRDTAVDFEAPAVQLYKLVSRTVSSSCNVYSVAEKQQLRNLMYMLSHNQIYVNTDVKRGNAAYWKEYGFQKNTRRNASCQVPRTLPILRMSSVAYPKSQAALSKFWAIPHSPSSFCENNRVTNNLTTLFGRNISRNLGLSRKLDFKEENTLLLYLSKVDNWDFDAFRLDEISGGHSLASLCNFLFGESRHNFFEHFGFSKEHFRNYILQIEAGYGSGEGKGTNNAYHNRRHAADVTQAVHYFITSCGLGASLTDIEMLSLFLGAIVHDFKHPGRSNAFLMNSCNELALVYNDISVLENYHASEAFQVLRQDECNFLRNMDSAAIGSIRHLAIQIILATDLKFHFDFLGEFNLHLSDIQNEIREEGKARTYLSAMKMCIKSADISHPARPMYIHLRWSKCLMEEFLLQGDEEKIMGIEVSPNCDRNDLNISGMQKSFINFLVNPLFKSWVSFLHHPNAAVCMTYLNANEAMWSGSMNNNNLPTRGDSLDRQLSSILSERSQMASNAGDSDARPALRKAFTCSKVVECNTTTTNKHRYSQRDEAFHRPNGGNDDGAKDVEIGRYSN